MRYRSFKEARKFVRTLGLKTQKEWFSFCKSGKKPDDIPITPYNIYKNKGWKSLGDWLGTGRIADQNKIFRDFVKARKFVRALKLKNQPDWSKYCKSGKKPADIPTTPERVYKNKGWKSLGDWLGTKNIANRYVVFRNFKDARKFARSLKLKSGREWQEYCESGKKPDDIPKSPDQAYKKEWKNWGDWLGNRSIQPQKRVFRDFVKARKFVRALKLKNTTRWKKYCSSGKKPIDIPSAPERVYKNKGWKDYQDWLDSKYISSQKMQYLPFKEARKFVHTLKLKSQVQWGNYCKSGKKPADIPTTPERVYKNKGWKDLGDWLGTYSISTQNRAKNYLPFKEAEKEYKKLAKQYHLIGLSDWRRFSSTHKKSLDDLRIPANPWNTYTKEQVWKRMME